VKRKAEKIEKGKQEDKPAEEHAFTKKVAERKQNVLSESL
jgi:hypothetical protein